MYYIIMVQMDMLLVDVLYLRWFSKAILVNCETAKATYT